MHLFNACITLLLLSGIRISRIPIASSLYLKGDQVLVDDEKCNCIIVTDDEELRYMQAHSVHLDQLREALELAQDVRTKYC